MSPVQFAKLSGGVVSLRFQQGPALLLAGGDFGQELLAAGLVGAAPRALLFIVPTALAGVLVAIRLEAFLDLLEGMQPLLPGVEEAEQLVQFLPLDALQLLHAERVQLLEAVPFALHQRGEQLSVHGFGEC